MIYDTNLVIFLYVCTENDANGALQKGRRNQTREEPSEEAAKAARAAGGTDRRTRSSARTRK